MIPDETYIKDLDNNRKDDLSFVPFNNSLFLNSPQIINSNNNFKEDDSTEDIPPLFFYNVDNNFITKSLFPNDILRNSYFDFDDETDLIRDCSDNNIDNVFKSIEDNNPGTLTLMEAYNIPYPIAKLIGRRFIKLTLDFYKRSWLNAFR